jgi:hypothetical protein
MIDDVQSFLAGDWSLPLRRACPHLSNQVRERLVPDTPAPRWAQPQFLLYLLAEAISERLAWQATQPGEPRYRYGDLSMPAWEQALAQSYTLQYRHAPGEWDLFSHLGREIECLYRILRTPVSNVGMTRWTLTLLAECQQFARLYRKLRRRCQAPRARELLGQALATFMYWSAGEVA